MASRFLHEAQRGAGSGSIDLPLAIVAGLSVGFVAFMLPGDMLARAVEMSRLPELLAAAAPPLGAKARIAVALAAAGATFAAVYLLLRTLGRNKAEAKERVWPEADTEREPETPRLRRSDVHPDAPARRPILAARELGEPGVAPPASREEAPVEIEPAPAAAEEALDLSGPGIEMIEAEPEPIVVESVDDEPGREEPAEPAPAPLPTRFEPAEDASIAELMTRLERGLERRLAHRAVADPASTARPAAAAPASAPAAEVRGDDRLRSAIENLQNMAARAR